MGSHFQFYGLPGLLKAIHRIINSGDSQLVKKNADSEGRVCRRWAEFSKIYNRYNYELPISQFYGFTELLKSNVANRPFR